MAKRKEGRFICKCECGGDVRGVEGFDRTWSWCEACTPVVDASAFAQPEDASRKRGE